jgi:hypothetical protein
MKRYLAFVAVVIATGVIPARAAVFEPSIVAPIRDAIVEELAALTNNPSGSTQELRQRRLLRQAQRTLDRAGRPSLFGDVQILASLASSLRNAFPDGEFDLLLQVAIADYRDALVDATLSVSNRLSTLPASGANINASNTMAGILTTLAGLDPRSGITGGIQALTRASVRLRALEGLLTRTRPASNRGDRMTARVENAGFLATGADVSAIYNAAGQFLTLNARQVSGVPPLSRSIKLFVANVTASTTTHSLGSPVTGTYAIYSAASSTNSDGFTSSSGTATITLDTVANTVSGRFSFSATDELGQANPVRVTAGEFFAHLQ